MRTLKKELWPHKISLNIGKDLSDDKIYDIEIWLGENLGYFRDRLISVYTSNSTDFYFRQGRDATMFALKWS